MNIGRKAIYSRDLKSDHLKFGNIWNLDFLRLDFIWLGFKYGCSYIPINLKTRPFQIWTFSSGFQMVFDKMAAIYQDFKFLGFGVSNPIQNPDHLQHNLYLTIQIQTSPDFRSPLYFTPLLRVWHVSTFLNYWVNFLNAFLTSNKGCIHKWRHAMIPRELLGVRLS